MKKALYILGLTLAICALLGIFWFVFAFFGNPVSFFLAEHAAKDHLQKQYVGTDYIIEQVNYSFKDGNYYARIHSPSSMDTHFTVAFDGWGNLCWDSWESQVLNRDNTWRRINDEYRELIQSVTQAEDFPYECDIDYGEITILGETEPDSPEKDFGLELKELELDKEYDIWQMGQKHGRLIFYTYDEDVSVERASEILLELKRIMDENGVPFYAIKFVLRLPKSEDYAHLDGPRINLIDFLYSDIYEQDLVLRVQAAAEETSAYFARKDAEKQVEIQENNQKSS